jgi:hypothetical protein
LVPHLDQNRVGGYQMIIALSSTVAVVHPGSHKIKINRGGTGYYKLQANNLKGLTRT